MRSLSRWLVGNSGAFLVSLVLLGVVLDAGRCRAGETPVTLQLEVVINAAPIQIIGSFVRFADGRIAATGEELESLGLRPRQTYRAGEIVALDDVPTLKYQYDEPAQRILITVGDVGRNPKTFDLAGGAASRLVRPRADFGAVVNYDLLSSTSSFSALRALSLASSSLSLSARAFSPYGTAEQSGIVRAGPLQSTEVIRLNSSYRYSDQDRMVSYIAGDTINGGLPWTRPVRIGGLQAQRDFTLRPDLITAPLASLGGSAAVPSTVDVYVNNIKTFSQEVGTGPFSVNNVPLISGAGTTELVIRDSAGHETRSATPFYATSSLLAPGLMSWSVEGGLPRLAYGSTSDIYVNAPVGSATLRRGIFDGLTVEAHAEAGAGVVNGGLGAVVKTGTIAVRSQGQHQHQFHSSGRRLKQHLQHHRRFLFARAAVQSFAVRDRVSHLRSQQQHRRVCRLEHANRRLRFGRDLGHRRTGRHHCRPRGDKTAAHRAQQLRLACARRRGLDRLPRRLGRLPLRLRHHSGRRQPGRILQYRIAGTARLDHGNGRRRVPVQLDRRQFRGDRHRRARRRGALRKPPRRRHRGQRHAADPDTALLPEEQDRDRPDQSAGR
jgi:hypothetical protein